MNWNWYVEVLKKYAVFEGRSAREEFWVYALVNLIVTVVLHLILPLLGTIYALAVLLPSLAVGARRLHDIGRSGWWLLLSLLPPISLVLLYFFVLDSQPGTNEYGPNPKTGA